MTAHAPLHEGALSLEQWQHIETLAGSLNASQARWLSGYFAGLDAGLLRGGEGQPSAAAEASARTLTILYGTETGNSREIGKALAAAAGERGLAPKLVDMSDYKVRQLKDEQDILFIVSTYGEGDPPQPSVGFFEFLAGPRAPRLDGVRYSVLALGDSTYEKYCEAGKQVDHRLAELGATRIHDRVDCDIDYEVLASTWSLAVVDQLAESRVSASVPAQPRSGLAALPYDKRNPFLATVVANHPIVGRNSTKDTCHLELDLAGSGLAYQPGDTLGIAPTNDPGTVDQLLEATELAGDAEVLVKGQPVRLSEALATRFEITVTSPRFIDQWARLSEATELKALSATEAAGERIRFLEQNHVLDVVRQFPVSGIDADQLLAGLRPLQPRLFSIASSQAVVGDEAHLTVAPVRYELHGTDRGGVASTQIADRLDVGAQIPVYVQENPHFRLAADDVPIIMVGPGTGVAPFRGFLQEREARGATGRSWLFFGERNFRSDFLYQVEWQEWLKAGVLSRLDVAFSRDAAAKVYVQHRMTEQAQQLYAWLEDGAHLYVCGDATAMAPDVHDALIDVVQSQGGHSRDMAEDYVRRLAADHRYHRDVY